MATHNIYKNTDPLFPKQQSGILRDIAPLILRKIPSLIPFQIQPSSYIEQLSILIKHNTINADNWLAKCAAQGYIHIVKLLLEVECLGISM